MALIDGMLQELEEEAQTTRRVLERVPDDRLGWRPHEKARTLGELALHVAIVPGGVAQLVASPSPAQAPQVRAGPEPGEQRRSSFPRSTRASRTAKQVLGGMDDASAHGDVATDERRSGAASRCRGRRCCGRSCSTTGTTTAGS